MRLYNMGLIKQVLPLVCKYSWHLHRGIYSSVALAYLFVSLCAVCGTTLSFITPFNLLITVNSDLTHFTGLQHYSIVSKKVRHVSSWKLLFIFSLKSTLYNYSLHSFITRYWEKSCLKKVYVKLQKYLTLYYVMKFHPRIHRICSKFRIFYDS